jgi:hypothetical protein
VPDNRKVSAIRQETREFVDGDVIAWAMDASQGAVDYVLTRQTNDPDGRSPWVWLRLANGDLVLGTFPRGDTYEYVSDGGDAEMSYP